MSEEAQNIDVEITEEKIEKAALPENRRVEGKYKIVLLKLKWKKMYQLSQKMR